MVESKNCTSINSAIYDDINSLLSKQEYSISLKEFSNYDEFYEDIIKEINIPKDKKELWKKTKIINLLRSASEQCQKNSGWASLADCGTWIKNNYPGTIHNHYGYEKLSQLIKDSHLFQIKKQYHKGSGACSLYIKYTG